MPNHVLPVLFMLLSTFSLSLTGLLTQYLSHIIPITLLGFLRFIIPALFLLVAMKLTHFRWPQRNMWFSLLIRAVCIAAVSSVLSMHCNPFRWWKASCYSVLVHSSFLYWKSGYGVVNWLGARC